jgi:hypothetical protein
VNIDKFKKGEDYVDPETGCCYDDAESYITTNMLGFCGCGDPGTALTYVRDSLRLLRIQQDFHRNAVKETWDEFWTRYQTAVDAHFKSSGAEYFMWYWLDNKGYTEHGSSVPGWLTEGGRELLEDLEELTAEAAPV